MSFEILVKNYAMEKFAGDESAVNDFMDAFVKEANAFHDLMNQPVRGAGKAESLGQTILGGLGGELGKKVGGLAMSLGTAAVGNVYGNLKNGNLHNKFLQSLANAIQSSRILKEAPREKVARYAETIFKFAPNIATDQNLLTSILTNAIHGDGIDPMTIKTLTELENRFNQNSSFSPKDFV